MGLQSGYDGILTWRSETRRTTHAFSDMNVATSPGSSEVGCLKLLAEAECVPRAPSFVLAAHVRVRVRACARVSVCLSVCMYLCDCVSSSRHCYY